MEPLIADVANAVEGKLRASFLQEDRADVNSLIDGFFVVLRRPREVLASEVVDQARRGQDVESAECAVLVPRVRTGAFIAPRRPRTGPTPCGSSWFPWMEKTGKPML